MLRAAGSVAMGPRISANRAVNRACCELAPTKTEKPPWAAFLSLRFFRDGRRPTRRLPVPLSAQPATRVLEHAHPRAPVRDALAPAFRMPAHLYRAMHALGVRHQHREAAVRRRHRGDAVRRSVRIERILLGR